MNKLKLLMVGILPERYIRFLSKLKSLFIDEYYVKSYSQEGEDMVLRRLMEDEDHGFYVDVGAHHPKRFSNTYYFYKKGWSGINIDATPGSMKLFDKIRPHDINIEAAVGDDGRELTFFIFNEPALNTFDQKLVRERSNDKYRVIQQKKITTQTLQKILKRYLPKGRNIKFMSIDVEGLDLDVVRSNDWNLFRPEYILIESQSMIIEETLDSEIYKFLQQQKYHIFAKTVFTLIFKDMSRA